MTDSKVVLVHPIYAEFGDCIVIEVKEKGEFVEISSIMWDKLNSQLIFIITKFSICMRAGSHSSDLS